MNGFGGAGLGAGWGKSIGHPILAHCAFASDGCAGVGIGYLHFRHAKRTSTHTISTAVAHVFLKTDKAKIVVLQRGSGTHLHTGGLAAVQALFLEKQPLHLRAFFDLVEGDARPGDGRKGSGILVAAGIGCFFARQVIPLFARG